MQLEIIICYLLIYIIEALILWQYCSNIFSAKYSSFINSFFALLAYIIPFIVVFSENFWLNTVLFCIANFVYIYLIYEARWYTALFHATITTILMTSSELLISGLISNLIYDFYEKASHFRKLAILAALSKILYFIFLQIVIHFYNKSKTKEQTYNFTLSVLTTVPVISLFIALAIMSISINTELSAIHDRMIATSAFALLIINIIVFGIYNYNQKKSHEFTELQIQFQKEYDSAEYYKMLTQQHEDQSILIHDIKKHLNSIALLNEQGSRDEIATYINRIIASDLRPSIRVCDNDLLNAILGRYLHLCQDKRIDLRLDIRSNSIEFLKEEDLTSLFCNLLDNALESAEKQEQSFIELNVSKKENTPFTVLTLTNSCRTNPFSPESGTLITQKKDKLRHGYGIKSINRIVNKYNGDIKMYYDQETTTFHTILTLKNLPQ